jgi:hypothetical protein
MTFKPGQSGNPAGRPADNNYARQVAAMACGTTSAEDASLQIVADSEDGGRRAEVG